MPFITIFIYIMITYLFILMSKELFLSLVIESGNAASTHKIMWFYVFNMQINRDIKGV